MLELIKYIIAINYLRNHVSAKMILAMTLVGKMMISLVFCGIYIYTIELFPTKARHVLMGVCSMTGRIGSMSAPQTPLLVGRSYYTFDIRVYFYRTDQRIATFLTSFQVIDESFVYLTLINLKSHIFLIALLDSNLTHLTFELVCRI